MFYELFMGSSQVRKVCMLFFYRVQKGEQNLLRYLGYTSCSYVGTKWDVGSQDFLRFIGCASCSYLDSKRQDLLGSVCQKSRIFLVCSYVEFKRGVGSSQVRRIYSCSYVRIKRGCGISQVHRIYGLFICRVQKGVCGGGNENPKRQKIGKRQTDKMSTKTRILVD